MNKPRSDSVIDSLPENQREALEGWLFEENLSYKDAKERLWQDFSVRCSVPALSAFYQRCGQRRLLAGIAESARKANAVVQQFEANPAPISGGLMQRVGQIAFEMSLTDQQLNVKSLNTLAKLVLAHEKQRLQSQALHLEERRVKLLEEKAAKAEAAEGTLKDTKLTPTEQQARLREIFGLQ